MLHAFGAAPHLLVLVLAYFLGTTCNVLPLPGSLSGGLAGALVALGTPAAPAIAAVLAYRTVAVWVTHPRGRCRGHGRPRTRKSSATSAASSVRRSGTSRASCSRPM